MARSHRKILFLSTLFCAGFGFDLCLQADPMIGNEVSGEGMKMPVYGEETLDYILTSKEVIKNGDIITSSEAVIEFIHPEADTDEITFMEELIPYPLRAPESTVVKFWNDRIFSSAILSSPSALIDQNSSLATSEGPVYFRSPIADLDGVGYVADYQNRTVLVRSKVEMVGRPSLQSKEAVIEAASQERTNPEDALLDTLQVWSDTLFIDMNNNRITLTGSVKLQENRIDDLRCDKMIITFETEENTQEAENGENLSTSGRLSSIVCEGEVFIREARGDLFCDKLTLYFTENSFGDNELEKMLCENNIKLVGRKADGDSSAAPEQKSGTALSALSSNASGGTLYANYGEFDFPANLGFFRDEVIAVADNGSSLACDTLSFHTADIAEGDVIPEQPEGSDELPSRIGITEDKELISVVADGNVQMESNDPGDGRQVITGSRAVYTVGTREIEMIDEVNGYATLFRYKDRRKYMSRQIFIDANTGDARGVDFRSLPLK